MTYGHMLVALGDKLHFTPRSLKKKCGRRTILDVIRSRADRFLNHSVMLRLNDYNGATGLISAYTRSMRVAVRPVDVFIPLHE
jgi:hypothetical protein